MDEYAFDNEIELLNSYIVALENKVYDLENKNEELRKTNEEYKASIRVLTVFRSGDHNEEI